MKKTFIKRTWDKTLFAVGYLCMWIAQFFLPRTYGVLAKFGRFGFGVLLICFFSALYITIGFRERISLQTTKQPKAMVQQTLSAQETWKELPLQPYDEEKALIAPFLAGRLELQDAMVEWMQTHQDTVVQEVDFLAENPTPPLLVDLPKLFQCNLDINNQECTKFPYTVYQTSCSYQGCNYFMCRVNAPFACAYVIMGTMNEHYRWSVTCFDPKHDAGEDFCAYLRREGDI